MIPSADIKTLLWGHLPTYNISAGGGGAEIPVTLWPVKPICELQVQGENHIKHIRKW